MMSGFFFCPHFNSFVFIINSSSDHKEILHMTRQQCCDGMCIFFYRFEGHLSDLNCEQNLNTWEHKLGLSANSADRVLIVAQTNDEIIEHLLANRS